MCGILDASAVHEVIGPKKTDAGIKFVEWIEAGRGRLVVGGKLLEELDLTSAREWARQGLIAGTIRGVHRSHVDERTDQLQNEGSCKSNDPHVIALAQVSGARLLYSNDDNLQQDFKDKKLLNDPQGKVYPARGDGEFRDGSFEDSHKRLLRTNLCGT